MGCILRTIVYVDGFNLYYRGLRKTAFKWLDLNAFAKELLGPNDEIVAIRYFTADISPRAGDADRPDAEVDSTSESAATISATVGTAFTCDNFVAFDVTVGINRDALTAADTVDADDCAVNAQVEVGFRRASKTPVRSRLGEWIDIAIDRVRVFVWCVVNG